VSHFCKSSAGDDAVVAVALSGAPEVTAYVWGGSSGPQAGQILDLLSDDNSVRIVSENTSAPANWIVSYKIPAKHRGMTFIGVKPGSTGRETSNSIRIGIETADAARARCGTFPKRPVLVPPPGCPARFPAALWPTLLDFSKQYEGITDFFYNDRSTPQLITFGIGKMVKNAVEAQNLRNFFINPDGQNPSDPEILRDYNAAASIVRDKPPGNLYDFAAVTILRLPWEKIIELFGVTMRDNLNQLMFPRPQFANFERFPADAQLACASIAYGGWGHASFAPLLDAVQAQNWSLAAEVYRAPAAWDQNKNRAHIALFLSAAGNH